MYILKIVGGRELITRDKLYSLCLLGFKFSLFVCFVIVFFFLKMDFVKA